MPFPTVLMPILPRDVVRAPAALALAAVIAGAATVGSGSDAFAQQRSKGPKPTRVAEVKQASKQTTVRTPRRSPLRSAVRGQMQIVVSIPDQRMDVYDGTVRVASTRVSTGKRGHATPRGVFSVIQKNRRHYSNIYNNAPMPYMQRLTWSGIALHAGAVPRYPASHGCIRMPHSFARKLFGMTDKHAKIIVNRGRSKPTMVDHPALFHPRPMPVKARAAKVAGLTLDGIASDQLYGRDALVLRAQKADAFAAHLRAAHHPNAGARKRQQTILVQQMMIFLGATDMKRPDGDLGPVTRRLIRKFQKSRGMKVTGRPSSRLAAALYTAVGHKMIGMDTTEADAMMTPRAADAPLRILVTRRLAPDDVKRAQQMLEELGYWVGGADGAMGRNTREAIVAFRAEAGLAPVKARAAKVDTELLQALIDATGATMDSSMNGRIFVRQGYRDVYEAPISIKDIDTPLGTHVFSSMGYSDDRVSPVDWTALTVVEQGRRIKRHRKRKRRGRKNRRVASNDTAHLPYSKATAAASLDRLNIPEEVRAYIEQNLTPGSSMIISDHGSSHETGEGTDFIVLTK